MLALLLLLLLLLRLRHAEARGSWTSKQDLIQVFGLRKVYKLAGGRRWWQFWRPKQPQQQEKKQYVAVVDSWFGVPKGQLLCLLGPNGAGKTTSINCLIGERWGRGRGTLSWWQVLTGLPDWLASQGSSGRQQQETGTG